MRLALLAGLVGIAVLVAVVVLAREGGDAEAEEPWGRRASAVCERGLTQARAVIAEAEEIADAEERALHLYRGATEVEADVLAGLEALPQPAGSHGEIESALQILRDSHDADVAAVAELERDFDASLLEQRVNETVPITADLRTRFLTLEADGCARYLNPSSYG